MVRRLQDLELYSLIVVAREEHAARHRLVGDCLQKAAVQGLGQGRRTRSTLSCRARSLSIMFTSEPESISEERAGEP